MEDGHNKTIFNELAHNYWWPSSLHNSPTKNKNVNRLNHTSDIITITYCASLSAFQIAANLEKSVSNGFKNTDVLGVYFQVSCITYELSVHLLRELREIWIPRPNPL